MNQTLKYFKEITLSPRPSKKEEKIREFLIDFFSKKGFEYKVDKIGNLVVYVPAKNSISKETVILQSHMDMVCVKTADSDHDFLKDPIQTYEKDGYMYALNTTLGADNGIGIAYSMVAVDFLSHPKMELVFTIDEEAGMSGILGLDFSLLSGTKIINLDSEDENEICISSAGGIEILGSKVLEFETGKYEKYYFELFGMKGGHSGVEIDKNRGNIIIVLLDFMSQYNKNIELYDIKSGVASNVIPSKINCILGIDDGEDFKKEFTQHLEITKNIFDCPEIDFTLTQHHEDIKVIKNGIQILNDLKRIENGVYSMSQKIDGLVQTSTNFGIIKIEGNQLKNIYLSRSSDNEELKNIIAKNSTYLNEKGFLVDYAGGYPGWQDDPDSMLLKTAKEEFEKHLGKTPKITAIHAGLECGALVGGLKNEEVNAISIGPNIQFVHSPEERVEIQSVKKVEKILAGILSRI